MTSEPTAPVLRLSQDPWADALLSRNPFALLVGLALDQQIPTERAMAGPAAITERIGRDLDPAELAEYDPEQFAAVLSQAPPVHRAPVAMAARIQRLATFVAGTYGGDVTRMWSDGASGAEVVRRFEQLPGFGKPKARILLALLGKQLGVTPAGWREAAAPYGEPGSRLSIADVIDPDSLEEVRAAKRERKLAKRGAAGKSAEPGGIAERPVGKKTAGHRAAEPSSAAGPTASHLVAGSGVAGVRAPR